MQALRILDAAVRLRSFTGAAQELGLTHGAVSRQMRQLEARAGVSLFRRRGLTMEPTEAAMAMAARTGHALRALADMFDKAKTRSPARQRLRLATTTSFARFWLSPRLSDLASVSGVQISAIETGAELVRFDQARIDVAIRYGRGAWAGVQSRWLGAERTFPVASADFARRRQTWDAMTIAQAPLIANAFVSWRAWLEAAALPASTALNVVLETSDSSFSLDAAVAGVGVALARRRLAQPMLARGALVALSDIAIDDGYAYYLAWPAASRRKSAIDALSTWLVRQFEAETRSLGISGSDAGRD
jgi:DNA-binding transcriptional LysR family regulator